MRVLIVGLGSMGRRRIRNLRALGGVEVAGCELEEARREAVAAEAGIDAFGSLEDGLAWRPDAVVVSTPPDQHGPPALAAARAGLPFFTEASVVSDGMAELIAAVDRIGVVAAPSCTLRFHPAVQTMRRLLGAGAIGRPLAVTHHVGQYLPDWHPWEDYRSFYVARRRTGAAREIVPFELNWLTYLFGPVRSVTGVCAKLSSLDADIDDIYSSVVELGAGVHVSLVVEVISRPAVRAARIVGEEGTLVWDWSGHAVREWSAAAGEWVEHADPPPRRPVSISDP